VDVGNLEMITMSLTTFFFDRISPALDQYQANHQEEFKDSSESKYDESKEQSVEHYERFVEFGSIFESLVDEFVTATPNLTMGTFRVILEKASSDRNSNIDSMASMLLDLLDAIIEYKSFLGFMSSAGNTLEDCTFKEGSNDSETFG